MSTFGRETDRLAEQRRRHERKVAEKAMTVRDCVCFSLAVLADTDTPDDVARKTALEAMRIARSLWL
jgi:hypothetical protein